METCVLLHQPRTENEATMSNEISTTESPVTENQATQSQTPKTDAAVEQVIESAVGLGRLWAKHGLTIGRLALETSATSLGTTARMLASIADAIAPEEPKADKAA